MVTDPSQPNVDAIMLRIYEICSDYVMKNPFHTPEMPIRSKLFDTNVAKLIKAL